MLEVERRMSYTGSEESTLCLRWKSRGGNVVPGPNRTEVESCAYNQRIDCIVQT